MCRSLTGVQVACVMSVVAAGLNAQEVFVQQGMGEGRGLVRSKDGQCFVVTPGHVVSMGPDVRLARDGRIESTGQVQRVNNIVALVKVVQNQEAFCRGAPSWPDSGSVSKALTNAQGVLRVRMEDGSLRNIPVNLTNLDPQSVRVTLQNPKDPVIAGLSGSSLFIGGTITGMLDSVTLQRTGTVVRLDYASQVLGWPLPKRGHFPLKGALAVGGAATALVVWLTAGGKNGETGGIIVTFPN